MASKQAAEEPTVCCYKNNITHVCETCGLKLCKACKKKHEINQNSKNHTVKLLQEKIITDSLIVRYEAMGVDTTEKGKEEAKLAASLSTDSELTSKKKKTILTFAKRLGLDKFYPGKLTVKDVMLITSAAIEFSSLKSEADKVWFFLHQIMMLNHEARSVTTSDVQKTRTKTTKNVRRTDTLTKSTVHPLDMILVIMYCSDMLLQQFIVQKLADCQIALPFLFHDPCRFKTNAIFPLWALRSINKSWYSKGFGKFKEAQMIGIEGPVVSFIKIGSTSRSKSKLLNDLLTRNSHDIFLHRNSKGSCKKRFLVDGTAEFCWYLPKDNESDFSDMVIFVNLRGDAGDYHKQVKFISGVSNIVIVFTNHKGKTSESGIRVLEQLQSDSHFNIILNEDEEEKEEDDDDYGDDDDDDDDGDNSDDGDNVEGHNQEEEEFANEYSIGTKNMNDADIKSMLQKEIKNHLDKHSDKKISVEECSKRATELGYSCDETNQNCAKWKKEVDGLLEPFVVTNDLATTKKEHFPLQGKIWHQMCLLEHSLYQPKLSDGESVEQYKCNLRKQIGELRQKQKNYKMLSLMTGFIKTMSSISPDSPDEQRYFVKLMHLNLARISCQNTCLVRQQYHALWTLKITSDTLEERKRNKDLKSLHKSLTESAIGFEHILRELAQYYTRDILNPPKQNLPSIAASLLINGSPLELMDGDAVYVSLNWISAVLDDVSKQLKDPRVFVVNVIGIQSSGKSTLLNGLFGLQFSVGVGRCTRGVYMQLLKIDNLLQSKVGYEYVLIVDTEGLRAPELLGDSSHVHDNKMATFVIGLGDLTLINISGEYQTEMQDILQIAVQAFIRMKMIKLSPKCFFVHQNVTEVGAYEKLVITKQKMIEQLDEMTKISAKMEMSDEKQFSDVIKFDILKHVWYIPSLWDGDPPMARPSHGYSTQLQKLKTAILTISNDENSFSPNFSEFKVRIGDLWRALLQENFVFSFRNSLQLQANLDLQMKIRTWRQIIYQHILDWQNQAYTTISNAQQKELHFTCINLDTKLRADVEKLVKTTKLELDEYLDNHPHRTLMIQWKCENEQSFDYWKDEWTNKAVKSMKQKCDSQEVQCKVLDMKIKHMNLFTEESQTVALTLDSNADEKTIIGVFDKFWSERLQKLPSVDLEVDQNDMWADAEKILLSYEKTHGLSILKELARIPLKKRMFLFKFEEELKKHIKVKNTFLGFVGKLNEEQFSKVVEIQDSAFEEQISHLNQLENEGLWYSIIHLEEAVKIVYDCLKKERNYNMPKELLVDFLIFATTQAVDFLYKLEEKYKHNNDLKLFLERQKEQCLEIFSCYVKRASSGYIAATQFLKAIERAIKESLGNSYVIIARNAMESVEDFRNSRYDLEKSVLKNLVEKKDFKLYMEYIKSPRSYMNKFIADCFERYSYSNDQHFSNEVKDLMRTEILKKISLIEKQLRKINSNDAYSNGLSHWVDVFLAGVKGEISISRGVKLMKKVKLDTVGMNCFVKSIEEGIQQTRERCCKLLESIPSKWKKQITDKATEFCQKQIIEFGCWEQCPFCSAVCTHTDGRHKGPHSLKYHRPKGITGWCYKDEELLSINSCSVSVGTNEKFKHQSQEKWYPYKKYYEAGHPYNKWSIPPDNSLEPHWKWFVATFQKDIEDEYERKCKPIPHDWKKITSKYVLFELQQGDNIQQANYPGYIDDE